MDVTRVPDERLELIFTCCHPALTLDAQVALTLRTLGGLTTGEIARALTLVHGDAERRLLERRLAELDSAAGPRTRPR